MLRHTYKLHIAYANHFINLNTINLFVFSPPQGLDSISRLAFPHSRQQLTVLLVCQGYVGIGQVIHLHYPETNLFWICGEFFSILTVWLCLLWPGLDTVHVSEARETLQRIRIMSCARSTGLRMRYLS